MNLKINRYESKRIRGEWTLVYGRRKTGKTFMLKNFIRHDQYFLVGRTGTIWSEVPHLNKFTNVNDFIEHLILSLNQDKKIIVDEFQRLPFEYLERVMTAHPEGQLILAGSSMAVIKKVFDPNSPLLGFFKELYIGMIRQEDILKKLKPDAAVDYATYLRDPWLIPMMKGSGILEDLYDIVGGARYTIPGLLGEIFHEEYRNMSEVFEGILGSIGSGYNKPSEIASILYHRGTIKKDSASQVAQYIVNLMEMGLLKQIKIYRKKRAIYKMISPIFSTYYYLNDKYGLERGLPEFSSVKENLRRIHSLSIEDFVVEALAGALGGEVRYSFEPELDGIIVDRKERSLAVVEVKWGRLSSKDISDYLDKIDDLGIGGRKIIVTKNMQKNNEVEIMDAGKLVRFLSSSAKKT